MTTIPRWYARPDGLGVALRKTPCLASWNKSSAPEQVRIRDYLDDTAELLAPILVRSGPWALILDVGLPLGRDLIDMADLDNYAYPLAARLGNERLVSVWCTRRHAETSRVLVAPAQGTTSPDPTFAVRTTLSPESLACKERFRPRPRPRSTSPRSHTS